MSAVTTGIDHVLVGVRDLEAARRAYQHRGFAVCPRGRHIGWGTANYCVMFPEGYVELLGMVDPARFTNDLNKFLDTREGLLGVAFASGDAAAAAETLRARGIAAEAPRELKRNLELPEGEVEPAFMLVHLPAEAAPGTRAFICQHLIPKILDIDPLRRFPKAFGQERVARRCTGIASPAPGPNALGHPKVLGSRHSGRAGEPAGGERAGVGKP